MPKTMDIFRDYPQSFFVPDSGNWHYVKNGSQDG
jgi:hypothetical protein